MPRGYRCIIVAFVGWLNLAAADPQQASGKPAGTTNQDVASTQNNVATAPQQANEPKDYKQPCDDGSDNRNSDLCAQWKAADATRSSATATWVFGYVGGFLGLLTLGAAIAAAYYAREAARHTKSGADEAKRAADAAEKQLEGSRHSTRACLTPESEKVRLDAGDPPILRVEYRARNTGQTPAQGLLFSVSRWFKPHVGGRPKHLGMSVWRHGTVGPTHPIELYIDVVLTDEQSQMLEDGVAEVALQLQGIFTTAFDERWIMTHNLVIEPQSLENGLVYTADMKQGPAEPQSSPEGESASQEPGLDFEDGDK